jgi:hypothetical protein
MIRASLIVGCIVGALLFFAWTITLNNNNLIRAEINAATNCASKVK